MFHLFIILFCSFILFLDVFSLRFNNLIESLDDSGFLSYNLDQYMSDLHIDQDMLDAHLDILLSLIHI